MVQGQKSWDLAGWICKKEALPVLWLCIDKIKNTNPLII